jgi:hypothetical protein
VSETQDDTGLGILRRIEPMLHGIREDMAAIKAVLPSLATKADLAAVKGDVAAIQAVLPTLATKSEVAAIQAVMPTLAAKSDVSKLGYDLTWRLVSLIAVILAVYLGAVWWIVHFK